MTGSADGRRRPEGRPQRTDLFPTPVWSIDLVDREAEAEHMAEVALAVLAEHPLAAYELYEQSAAVLQEVEDPSWRSFFRLLADMMQDILAREMPVQFEIERAFLRSWVLRISDTGQYRTTGTALNALHSHVPAVLSSVLYLQVPEGLVDRPYGGTSFRDPTAVNSRAFRTPEAHIAPRPMRLVIFPSYLEHLPEPVPPGIEFDRPRLVVATDLRVHTT